MYAEGRKLVVNRETGTEEIFDLHDRLDQHPLADRPSRTRLLEHLRWYGQLQVSALQPAPAAGDRWSEREEDLLRALGYAE